MSEVFLKILSDLQCDVYVDDIYKATANQDVLEKIPLIKGEYVVQLVSTEIPSYKIKQVVLLEYDRVLIGNFFERINESDLVYVQNEKSYKNLALNIPITPPIYEEGMIFSEGVAKVKRNGLWGCINKVGIEVVECKYLDKNLSFKVVIPCEYDVIRGFTNGLAMVKKNSLWGYIDEHGDEVVPSIYSMIGKFNEGLASAQKNGKWGYVNNQGEEVIPCIYDTAEDFNNGVAKVSFNQKYGFINSKGVEVLPCKYSYLDSFSDGLLCMLNADGGKHIYLDTNFDVVLELSYMEYQTAHRFIDGFAIVTGHKEYNYVTGSFIEYNGLIDIRGKEVIPLRNDNYFIEHGNSLIRIRRDEGWFLFNRQGKIISERPYYEIREYYEGLAEVCLDRGYNRWGFIDESGREIISCKYHFSKSFNKGIAPVMLNHKWGCIDKKGLEVIPFIYNDISILKNGCMLVAREDLSGRLCYGMLDKFGNEVIPCKYDNYNGDHDNAFHFCDGLARVTKKRKMGFINESGLEIVPCKYDYATDFCEGFAVVSITISSSSSKYGFIDSTGKEVTACTFDSAWDFTEGLARVGYGHFHQAKYGFIDTSGQVVIPCKYEDCLGFKEGLAPVKQNGMWGYINKKGEEVIPCQYESCQVFIDGVAAVQKKGKWGCIDKNGNEIMACRYDRLYQKDFLTFINDSNSPIHLSQEYILVELNGKFGCVKQS